MFNYGCGNCKRVFEKEEELDKHVESKECKIYECPHCGKTYTDEEEFKEDINRHEVSASTWKSLNLLKTRQNTIFTEFMNMNPESFLGMICYDAFYNISPPEGLIHENEIKNNDSLYPFGYINLEEMELRQEMFEKIIEVQKEENVNKIMKTIQNYIYVRTPKNQNYYALKEGGVVYSGKYWYIVSTDDLIEALEYIPTRMITIYLVRNKIKIIEEQGIEFYVTIASCMTWFFKTIYEEGYIPLKN